MRGPDVHLREPVGLLRQGCDIRPAAHASNCNRPRRTYLVLTLPGRAQVGGVSADNVCAFVGSEIRPIPGNAHPGRAGLFDFDKVVLDLVVLKKTFESFGFLRESSISVQDEGPGQPVVPSFEREEHVFD